MNAKLKLTLITLGALLVIIISAAACILILRSIHINTVSTKEPTDKNALVKNKMSNANKSLDEGNVDKALSELEDALSVDENNVEVMTKIASVYITAGRVDDAENILKKVLQIYKEKGEDNQQAKDLYEDILRHKEQEKDKQTHSTQAAPPQAVNQ